MLAALVAATVGAWAAVNRPLDAPDIAGRFFGAAYQPYRGDQSPTGEQPTVAQVDEDLKMLAQHLTSIRTYSSLGPLAELPRLADKYGLKVLQGIWVDEDSDRARREIEAGVPASRAASVSAILVGNESILRNDLTVPELARYLDEVRKRTGKQVSTAEPWSTWMAHPELAQHVDFIAMHVLPYWEETTTDTAFPYTADALRQMRARFPDKKLVVAEVGWPSDGRSRWSLTPSRSFQAQFIRQILDLTAKTGIDAYLMEAFDGRWKYTIEGSVGSYWGVFDAARQPKFPMTGPIQERPHWPFLAGLAVLAGLAAALWLRRRSPNGFSGVALQSAFAFAGASFVVWLLDVSFARYFTAPGATAWGVLVSLLGLLALVLAADVTEVASMVGRPRRRRGGLGRCGGLVSIHLPIHSEPPAVVTATLRALARVDWPELEVIVVDNNTVDPTLWRPVEAECAALNRAAGRELFRFIHVEGLAGFKAGALNLARRHTSAASVAIGVIDADYEIEPDWIRRAMAEFDDPQVGFVQAPQDHRDIGASPFKRAIGWEYAGFFHVGMVQRDLDNAIIQHGTMALIRRAALDRVGGWAEWCITEDAELGLRLHADGWQSVYIRDTLGRGLLPDDWHGYARQRHRWAYGGMRIIARHWRLFMPGSTLSPRQRLRYAAGWLPWIGDALGLVFAAGSVMWTVLLLLFPEYIELPDTALFVPAIAAFIARALLSFTSHRVRVPCRFGDSVRGALAGIALAPTIGAAVLHAAFAPDVPFRRTPKGGLRTRLRQALSSVQLEAGLAAALLSVAGLSFVLLPSAPSSVLWGAALAVQAEPFLLAVGLAAIAARPGQPEVVAPALPQSTPQAV